MKIQTPVILLTALFSYVSADTLGLKPPNNRYHARDFADVDSSITTPNQLLDEQQGHHKRVPKLPENRDETKLHVWLRTDTASKNYQRKGVNYDGLNQLIHDTGGRHKDVVVGNPTAGYYQYGLQFSDDTWKTLQNADGANIEAYWGPYYEIRDKKGKLLETFVYRGQVGDGRRTLNSIGSFADTVIYGHTYNHATYNCQTFALDLITALDTIEVEIK
ncbi:hypothetical protein F5Y18DRAFT_440696 [Xylariaceae sp. FL1019]|nr:hypothetical protein F5Y18DRAFT_440696 [Xylariaceae sp. FL1019]